MTTRRELTHRLPDDDTVWRHRHRTWAMWVNETSLKQQWLVKHLERRGWKKGNGNTFSSGGMERAPCRLCGASFKPTLTQRKRVCPECVTHRPQTILEHEYQLHLLRVAEADYDSPRRIYTFTPHVTNSQAVA